MTSHKDTAKDILNIISNNKLTNLYFYVFLQLN